MEIYTCAKPKNRHSKMNLEKTDNHTIIQPIRQKRQHINLPKQQKVQQSNQNPLILLLYICELKSYSCSINYLSHKLINI